MLTQTLQWLIKLVLLWRGSCNRPRRSETRRHGSKCSLISQCKSKRQCSDFVPRKTHTETWRGIFWPLKKSRDVFHFSSYNTPFTAGHSESDVYANAPSLGRLWSVLRVSSQKWLWNTENYLGFCNILHTGTVGVKESAGALWRWSLLSMKHSSFVPLSWNVAVISL